MFFFVSRLCFVQRDINFEILVVMFVLSIVDVLKFKNKKSIFCFLYAGRFARIIPRIKHLHFFFNYNSSSDLLKL